MASRDLNINITSRFDAKGTTDSEQGLKRTEQAARRAEQELDRMERAARQQGAALSQSGAQADRFGNQLEDVGRTAIRTRRLLEDATKRLPKIEITADTTEPERQLAVLAQHLRDLSGKRIGIDLDGRSAANEAERIRRDLTALAAMHPEVVVGANIERALNNLQRVEREARSLDGRNVSIDVDVAGAAASAGAIGLIETALTAVRSSGPAAGIAVAAALAALPGVAAGAATGITVVLGGALAGLGLAAAQGSDAAQDAIGQLKEAVKRESAQMGQPFESVWTKIAQVAERELAKLSPVIRRALSDLAPDVESFVEHAGASLEELTPAIGGIERAFSAVLGKLGPKMPEIMRHLAAAITAITNAVEADPELLSDFAVNMAKIAEWAGNAVASLARLARTIQENANAFKAIAAVINPAAGILTHFGIEATKAERQSLAMGQASVKAADDFKVISSSADEASQQMQEAWGSAYASFAQLGELLSSSQQWASGQQNLAQAQERAAQVQSDGAQKIARAERDLADAHEKGAERIAAAKQRVKDAHRQAAEAVEAAQGRVRAAQAAVTAAIEEGAQREAAAQQRVQDARERAAQVAEDGNRRIEDATRRLADAETEAAARQVDADRRVADAHRRTEGAVEDLTAARERAQQRLEDLIAAESGAAMDEEGAAIAIERARQRMEEVNADPSSTDLDRREAELAFRQALARLEEVKRRNAELRDDLADAQRRGIEGSTEVVDALGRMEDARRAEGEAAEAAARQREESARTVADAERALADAHGEASRQQQDAARQLADAEGELDRTRVENARSVRDAQEAVARAQKDSAQVAQDAARQVAEAQTEAAHAVRDASREIMDAEQKVRDTRKDVAREVRDANDSVLESWAKMRGDAKLTSEQLLAELERQVRDQEQWADNLIRLSGRVPKEMLDELAKLGPGAAGIVSAAASMSDAELFKLIELYGRSGKSAGDTFASNLQDAGPVLRDIAYRQGQAIADKVREAMDHGRVGVAEAARRIGVSIDQGIMGDRVVTVRTELQEHGARASWQADGGILTGYAVGGITRFDNGSERHVAQISGTGHTRIWAEPETGGEAYIPLAGAKRGRSEAIMGQVAGMFGGMYLRPMGAMSAATSAAAGGSAGPNVTYNINVDASMNNPADVGAKVVYSIQEYERRSGTAWRRTT